MIKSKMKVLKVKRTCGFCKKEEDIDYKNLELLGKYISSKGKIHSRRVTNICAKHQRKISREIKRARILGLLPFKAS